jgi:hypothetical protein
MKRRRGAPARRRLRPDSPVLRRVLSLTGQLIGFPGTCRSTPAVS